MPLIKIQNPRARIAAGAITFVVLIFLWDLLVSHDSVAGALVMTIVAGGLFTAFLIWMTRRSSTSKR